MSRYDQWLESGDPGQRPDLEPIEDEYDPVCDGCGKPASDHFEAIAESGEHTTTVCEADLCGCMVLDTIRDLGRVEHHWLCTSHPRRSGKLVY